MKILITSPEMVPFAKTGGLADVIGALPKALKKLGHDVRVIIPKYSAVDENKYNLKLIKSNPDVYEAKIFDPEITVYFIDNKKYFDRKELYQENGRDYLDNAERFIFFSKAVLSFIKSLGWEPHILHANDWQSALQVAYIKTILYDDPFFSPIACVYSVHNMGYLGLFPKEKMPLTGLGWEYFGIDGLEFFGKIAFAKAGFIFADVISTVSETYAKEIQTKEFGHGLEGLAGKRSQDIFGIMNGVDYDIWNPEEDPHIQYNYDLNDLKGKALNKQALQKAHDLDKKKDIPIIGMVSRITVQKGFDILLESFEKIMELGCQFILLGAGEPLMEEEFRLLQKKYKGQVSINLGFDAALAQMIYAGSDMFLMPSRYEPCGLGQLISFKYGTVPIVRETGGLKDSVKDYFLNTGQGDGFVFRDYSGEALLQAVDRAVQAYKQKDKWLKLVKKVMKYDFSWDSAAVKYVKLYKEAIGRLARHVRTFQMGDNQKGESKNRPGTR